MFIVMAVQFNSPLRQIKNYSSRAPLGAINSVCHQAVRPGAKSTVTGAVWKLCLIISLFY